MKKYFVKIICFFVILSSCDVNENLNIDKKRPTKVEAEGLFTHGVAELSELMNSTHGYVNAFRLYAQYFAEVQYIDVGRYNQVNNNLGGAIWTRIYRNVLKNLAGAKEILNEMPSNQETKNKIAVLNFLEIYSYSILVDTFGDVPYTEAIDHTNPTPKYDDGETVYKKLFTRLNEAIANMGTGKGFSEIQDIVYKGDMVKWKKAANSLKLRMAMRIAGANPDLSKKYAEEAISSGLILQNSDNFGVEYLTTAPNTNPLWESLVQSGRRDFVAANTIVDIMNPIKDPRLSSYFKELDGKFVGGIYGSANSVDAASDLSDLMKKPDLPGYMITAAEVNFLLAEASERGYKVSSTTESYYNEGITASILEWGKTVDDVAAYLSQPSVAYTTAQGTWKQKIAMQKWIALFNNGFEGWTTWRIFDYPVLNPPSGMTLKDIPTRFLYPQTELQLNGTNHASAASAIGGDEKTTKLFWDKN